MKHTVTVRYFASLKEKAGLSSETISTEVGTAGELYEELRSRYAFPLTEEHLKVSINREYQPFTATFSDGDEIVFIPPVSGG